MTSWTPWEPDQHDKRHPRGRPAGGRLAGPDPPIGAASTPGSGTLPPTLTIVPWTTLPADPTLPRFPVSHRYVEVLWTPLLGPTQVMLLRRLSEIASPAGSEVEVADLAVAIGSRTRSASPAGSNSAVARAIERLARFRFVYRPSPTTLAVVTDVPPLSERDLQRLPHHFRELHQALIDESSP